MQEVFEKIIERLYESGVCAGNEESGFILLKNARKVVEQAAEGYNNGWIPCSERLPDEGDFYLVTIHKYGTEYCLFEDGKWYLVADGSLDENTSWKEEIESVIAWQPSPQRYEPKEDKS